MKQAKLVLSNQYILFITILFFLLLNNLTYTQTWTQLSTYTTPTSHSGHSAVYDNIHNVMVVFAGIGGLDGFPQYFNDIWVLSNANGLDGVTSTFKPLLVTGNMPTMRYKHTAVYDTDNNRMTIFGGLSYESVYQYENDVWVISNANGLDNTATIWTKLSPTGSIPIARSRHTAVYDPGTNRMIIFGGYNQDSLYHGQYLNDVWVLSNANGLGGTPSWKQLTISGITPEARELHTTVYDTTHNRIIMFGGYFSDTGYYYMNDVWVLNHANGLGGTPFWTQLTTLGTHPPVRSGHTSVYDLANNRMIIFGGRNQDGEKNDVWVLTHANGLGGIPSGQR